MGPKKRVLAGMMVNCTAATGVMTLSIIAAFARHWRGLQLFISVPSVFALLAIRYDNNKTLQSHPVLSLNNVTCGILCRNAKTLLSIA